MATRDEAILTIDGHDVRISNPDKPYFAAPADLTKLDLVNYYLTIAEGALRGIRDRPFVLKRFVNGAAAPPFYQKRAPKTLPPFVRTVTISFPSGRTADEIVVDNAAALAWVVNLGCIELHPHAVRANDLDHPDELRIDLDPTPGVGWDDIRRVAMEVRALLGEVGLTGWAKTSGSRGMHINVRIAQRWSFTQVRRAALALSRAIERRMPGVATSKWWKEERHGVFLDYNQNAKDRTTCSTPGPLQMRASPHRPGTKCRLRSGRFHRRHSGALGQSAIRTPVMRPLARQPSRPCRDEAAGLGDAPGRSNTGRWKASRCGLRRPAPRSGGEEKPARVRKPLVTVANSPIRFAARRSRPGRRATRRSCRIFSRTTS